MSWMAGRLCGDFLAEGIAGTAGLEGTYGQLGCGGGSLTAGGQIVSSIAGAFGALRASTTYEITYP